MKKRCCLALMLVVAFTLAPTISMAAEKVPWNTYTKEYEFENPYGELKKVRGTVYLPTGNKTRSGTVPKAYRTLSGRKEDLGKTVNVYSINPDGSIGELIFIGIIEDTGSAKWLNTGEAIDIFMDSKEAYKEFVKEYGDYFYIQMFDAEG